MQERGREARVLSPGLLYLEQVCQILEDIAKQQMQNRETQAEFDTLCEHQELQVSQVNSVTTEHFTMRHSWDIQLRDVDRDSQRWQVVPLLLPEGWYDLKHEDIVFLLTSGQAAGSCHPEAGDELTFRQGVRNDENRVHRATDPQQRKKYQHGHFRQRSASDTTIATLHLSESFIFISLVLFL